MKNHRITTKLVLSLTLLLGGCLIAVPLHAQTNDTTALQIESVFVRDMAMRDFAELLTRAFGSDWRVLVSDQAGAKRIRFYLADTGAEETLRSVCSAYGLWYRRSPRSGIVQVMTLEEYRQGISLYADETVEVLTIHYPAPEDIGETLARLFQDRVVWDPPSETLGDDRDRIERALDRMDTMADRATLTDPNQASRTTVDFRGDRRTDRRYDRVDSRLRDSQGYSDRTTRAATESVSLEEVMERQQREMRSQQTAYRTEDGIGESQAIRPGLVYVSASPMTNALVLRSSDAASLELVKGVARELDKPRPQVLLEVRVLDISLGDEQARGVDWLFQQGPGSDGIMLSGGASRGITAEPGSAIRSSDPVTLIPQGTGLDPLAAVFSVVSADVRARIQLLQDQQRIRSLATPSLLVADNEASRIFIGSEVTVLERVEPETEFYGEFGQLSRTVYTVTAPRKRIGTTLLITPKIHADRTVTLRILQEETRLGAGRTVRYGQTETDQFTAQDVEERSVTTTILAADGHAIAIGGLIRERQEERETGVPLLMDIPLLGRLFKRTIQSETRNELLVLVQPRVLLAPGEGAAASREFIRHAGYAESMKRTGAVSDPIADLGESEVRDDSRP